MDKTVCKVTDLAEQQAETYRYWRSRPSAERFEATWELSKEHYRKLGLWHDGQRMNKTIVRRVVGRAARLSAEESEVG